MQDAHLSTLPGSNSLTHPTNTKLYWDNRYAVTFSKSNMLGKPRSGSPPLRVVHANVLVEEGFKDVHAQLTLLLVLVNDLEVVAGHLREETLLNGKLAHISPLADIRAYLQVVPIEVNGQFQLVEAGHAVSAHEITFAVGDDELHIEAVCDAEEADDVGVCKAISS